LRLQDTYLHAGKFKQLWQLFTPRFRASCGSYAKFAAEAKRNRAQLKEVRIVLLSERIQGNKGYLKYRYVKGGAVLATVVNDLYVKIQGRWYDEVDKATQC
jgi:hypothetical protein